MTYKAYIFDWGNTLMVDFPYETGPMYQWNKFALCPNALETLTKLASIAPCYMATNAEDSSKEDIQKALLRGQLDSYITDIFCFHEFQVQKPSREYFERMQTSLKIVPEGMLIIGDSLKNDYLWAIDNGANAVLYDPQRLVTDPKVTTISDLLALVPD